MKTHQVCPLKMLQWFSTYFDHPHYTLSFPTTLSSSSDHHSLFTSFLWHAKQCFSCRTFVPAHPLSGALFPRYPYLMIIFIFFFKFYFIFKLYIIVLVLPNIKMIIFIFLKSLLKYTFPIRPTQSRIFEFEIARLSWSPFYCPFCLTIAFIVM